MTGKVEAIYIASVKRAPMVYLAQATISRTGIVGDRYEGAMGSWRKDPEKRHITLIEADLIEAANKTLLTPFEWDETRRNIVVSSFPLNNLVGQKFWIGDVLVEGTELCTPCKHPGNLVGIEYFDTAFKDRGGLRARILRPGNITVGTELKVFK